MKRKIGLSLASTLAIACVAGGFFALGSVEANAESKFSMIEGASVRLTSDGNYGIRFTAELGVDNETDLKSVYGETAQFGMMVIPYDYYTAALKDLPAGSDYYEALYDALVEAGQTTPYIADMEAEPFVATASDKSLTAGQYYVRGSLTNLQYANINREFIGLAYYKTEEGGERKFAEFTESGARDIVYVASKTLNAGEYAADSDQDKILDSFITQGVNQANGVTEENKNQEVTITPSLEENTYVYNKAEKQLEVAGLPENVNIAVDWFVEESSTLLDKTAIETGLVKPLLYGGTGVGVKVLGKTYTTGVHSIKTNDWTFNSNSETDSTAYDFTAKDYSSRFVSGVNVSDGQLKLTYNGSYGSILFYNSVIDSYTAGDLVRATMRVKYVDSTGADITEDSLRIWAFVGEGDSGLMNLAAKTKTVNGKNITITDDGEWKIISWDASINDYHQSAMHQAKGYSTQDTASSTANNIAYCHVDGKDASGNYYTLVVDYITIADIASYEVEDQSVLAAKTYGGNANSVNTEKAISVKQTKYGAESNVDAATLTYVSSNEAIAKVVDGKVVAGEKAGTATITVTGAADGKTIATANSTFTVTVKSPIASKFDLDMLALAYARGVHTTDWGKDAYYVLTNDIDYQGAVFLPIAAMTPVNQATVYIGLQWKTILAEGNAYGLSYADFVKKGANGTSSSDFNQNENKGYNFNATIDGQGYAIKNPQLMMDAGVSKRNATDYFYFSATMFGLTGNNATFKNLAIENITVQKLADLGYTKNNSAVTLDVVGGTSVTAKTAGYWFVNSCGVFGFGGGTFENVYIEMAQSTAVNTSMVPETWQWSIFGRLAGNVKMTDCVLIGKLNEGDPATQEFSIIVASAIVSISIDNVLVVSSLSAGGSASTSGFTFATDEAAYAAGIADATYSNDGFDSAYWDTTGDVPVLK